MARGYRRLLLAGLGLMAMGLAVGSLWLATWVPSQGKARLKAALEQRWPIDVSIKALRYIPWQGFVLDEVSVAARSSPAVPLLRASRIRARLGALSLLFSRRVSFRINGVIAAPCSTELTISGAYGLRDKKLIATILTSDISRHDIIPPVAGSLPKEWTAGSVRLKLRLHMEPGAGPMLSGQVVGTGLVWESGPLRFTGRVTVTGQAARSTTAARWIYDLRVRADEAAVTGVPIVEQITKIDGALHVTDERVDIQRLRGFGLDGPVELEGTVSDLSRPSVELLVRGQPELSALAARLPSRLGPWQPAGRVALTALVRGPLAQWPGIEVMARANVKEASCRLPKLSDRIERISAQLEYDHLTRNLTIRTLGGGFAGSSLKLQGGVRFATTMSWDLHLDAAAKDVAVWRGLLPGDAPVTELTGPAALAFDLSGTAAQPAWRGVAELRGVRVGWRGLPAVESIEGSVRLTEQTLATAQLSMRINGQPVVIGANVTDLRAAPKIALEARSSEGLLRVNGVLRPTYVALDSAELTLRQSRLQVTGQLARLPQQPSQLSLSGTVHLGDLSALPWVRLPILERWPVEGDTRLQLRLAGPLADWTAVNAHGSARAAELRVAGVTLQQLAAELEQSQGRLTIRITDSRLANGRLVGVYLVDHAASPARSVIEFDLTQADLAQLATALPSWREQHIQGVVSAHASLLGDWAQPSMLRGDGWVHANGEHLGQVPLLRRFFRGLFGALADRLGLSVLESAQVTEVGGQWRLVDGRGHSDDFRIKGVTGAQPISIYLKGSVGLDKTLDLTVEPELSEQMILEAPTTATLAGTVLKVVGGVERIRRLVGRYHLGGTIDNPQAKFQYSLEELPKMLLPSLFDQLLR